jgi:hypothetical protein
MRWVLWLLALIALAVRVEARKGDRLRSSRTQPVSARVTKAFRSLESSAP